jgi:hypothetical protein
MAEVKERCSRWLWGKAGQAHGGEDGHQGNQATRAVMGYIDLSQGIPERLTQLRAFDFPSAKYKNGELRRAL